MSKTKPKIIAIVGPTASGKSDLAVKLAKKFGGEIVPADSRQVYKGLDIGAGKITKNEMRGVPHYLLDVALPKKTFTVAQYQKLARKALQKILNKGELPIIVGGTGLYIDALLYGWRLPAVKPNPKLRQKLEKITTEELFLKLERDDPRRARSIDRHNKRRLIRASEIITATGSPIPPLNTDAPYSNVPRNIGIRGTMEDSTVPALKIGVKMPPEELRKRIKARLLKRLKQGMITEVKKLHTRGLSWQRLDDFGLEYRYVSRYLCGLLSKEEMIEKLETEIRHYAKRQMTWFKKDKNIIWIKNGKEAEKLAKNFLK